MHRQEPAPAGPPLYPARKSGCAPGSYYNQQRLPYRQQWSHPPSNHRFRTPESRPSPKPPNFIIHLRSRDHTLARSEFERLIEVLPERPQSSFFSEGSRAFSGKLFYEQWSGALEVIVHLWRLRLEGGCSVTPFLEQNVVVPSDKLELNDRLKEVFLEKLEALMEGELVQKCRKKLILVLDEISKLTIQLGKLNRLGHSANLLKKKEVLMGERDLISKRIKEFKNGVTCIMLHLKGEIEEGDSEVHISLFKLNRNPDWDQIHHIVKRECKRLEDGLPIFSFRKEILSQVFCHQVTILTGETGSGKSTQLVQFLADSGIGGNDAIVCTQPRKLAAASLSSRVKQESLGCYEDNNSVICYQSYSSSHQFDSKVIFMTDHCLLQQYMSDSNLSKISCIIVDEAHERSLNTDLLLALIKNLLELRRDMRLIIMSATADAIQLANYFYGCGSFHVVGRTFPVDIKYVPCDYSEGFSGSSPSYASNVVTMVLEIHNTEGDGTILAFLTSQVEVEWACEKIQLPTVITLPLHGKLSSEDQNRVFFDFPGKRKVIFATNIAETSLTIPGVKYVVDSGLVKQKWFEPGNGMNILRVCMISRSSANQRAGRAGRTEPGKCYRLFSETDFESMPYHEEPEIRKVHLGIALLRILALGIKDVQKFDFIDAPNPEAIEMTFHNLILLGCITQIDDGYQITADGRLLVKLGIEPRIGKILLSCFRNRLGREGLVLAAVMTNSSSIFCRVGTEVEKLKSDCNKVQFCHPSGDLFTFLSVYKEWDALPQEKKNRWCWDNSINGKTMRRCQETLQELETCLQNELRIIIPSYWRWNPQMNSEHDDTLKRIILSSHSENVAMYSGYDRLGYQVALTGKHFQLHPSCSLLNFCERPSWIVFGEILVAAKEYLVCATAFDFTALYALSPPPSFDFLKMDAQKLQKKVLAGSGSMLLKRFCGKSNCCLNNLVSRIRTSCMDERIGIEVSVDHNEITLYASSGDMDEVLMTVNQVLQHEQKMLKNECLEKCTHMGGSTFSASFALFGAGAEIKHLELDKRCLTVDIYHSNVNAIDDKELLMFLERNCGDIGAVHKFSGSSHDIEEKEQWGRVTFVTPEAANMATALNLVEFSDGMLKLVPSKITHGGDQKLFSSPLLKAKIYWPRRKSRGTVIVKCDPRDVTFMVGDFSSDFIIRGRHVHCERSKKCPNSIVLTGVGKEDSEAEIFEELSVLTHRKISDVFLIRGDAVEHPSLDALEEALLRELSSLMPKRGPHGNSLRVQVFQPEPKDTYMRATITFDGNLHLEAAKALEQIDGKVLPGCLSWQKIKCQQMFRTTLSCYASVYRVIKMELDALLARFKKRKGVECSLDRHDSGSYRVKVSANATKVVAEVRKPLEELMKGKVIEHASVTPTVLQHLFSWEGICLMKSLQRDTGTYFIFDKHNLKVRVFGSPHKVDMAHHKFVDSLLALHESKQLIVHLRGESLPSDLMKRVVQKCGPNLNGLKEMFPDGNFSLNSRHHCIYVKGTAKDLKQRVEDAIYEIAQESGVHIQRNDDGTSCPICLCEVDDSYKLESCLHVFCRLCLVEQCESAIRSRDGFPLRCLHKGCGSSIILSDLKSLLTVEKLEDLFRASLGAYVAANPCYRFCPSPDCPSVYRVGTDSAFVCGACYAETCTRCHLEYHPYLSCEKYRDFKDDPDLSLKEWSEGKENVKQCPACLCTIEKVEGCNHIECRCGKHVCWVCLEGFETSDDCYSHLRVVHLAIG